MRKQFLSFTGLLLLACSIPALADDESGAGADYSLTDLLPSAARTRDVQPGIKGTVTVPPGGYLNIDGCRGGKTYQLTRPASRPGRGYVEIYANQNTELWVGIYRYDGHQNDQLLTDFLFSGGYGIHYFDNIEQSGRYCLVIGGFRNDSEYNVTFSFKGSVHDHW